MKYFDHHPIFGYSFLGITYNFVDIFRKNILDIDDTFLETYSIETNDTLETISNKLYDDAQYSWVLALTNNYHSRSTLPTLETDITLSNNKIYSIITIPDIKFGDIVINRNDLDGFSTVTDPFLYVVDWNPTFRSIIVKEKLLTSNSFDESDTITVLRKNAEQTFDEITASGVSLERISDVEKFPIRFSLSGRTISPYLNVSGSGITYMPEASTGSTFTKTLLYSYITDGISHGAYTLVTEAAKFKTDKNDISMKMPNPATVYSIEDEIKKTMSITNKSRLFGIKIR